MRGLLGLALGAGIALLAYRRQTLTADGALAAALVGGSVFARGRLPAAAALLGFFVSSSALSRFKEQAKQRQGVLAQAKGGRRDAWQVLANGGWATLWIASGHRRGAGGFLGGLAAAAADTWGTELGMLAHRQPRLLTTRRAVPPGTSGGVTLEGLGAGACGAALVGLAWNLFGGAGPHRMQRVRAARDAGWARSRRRGRVLATVLVAGVAGSLADSLLGATLQAMYWCDACQAPSERRVHATCGQAGRLVGGLTWIDNDVVNGLASLGGSLVGAALWR